ncbi:hypothetical protein [Pedobacter terrae]|uniref:hypothetical protein n=1 Tax=Pedobacter terrae TaxID=405671 RepID=UPI002FF4898D
MKLEETKNLITLKIIKQGCRSSQGSSSVHVMFNKKVYYIRLANEECLKYPIGTTISLIYDNTFDYLYKPDGLKRNKYRVLFSSAFLLLSIIPWNRLISTFSKDE